MEWFYPKCWAAQNEAWVCLLYWGESAMDKYCGVYLAKPTDYLFKLDTDNS